MNEDGLLSSAGAALLPSAALDEPLEGSALEDAVEAFDATALTNAVDTYENLVIDAQAAVDGAISALSGARALDFGAAASAFTSAGDITASAAQTAASAVVSAAALDVASGDNLTDANINAALTAARAEIDGTNYYALNTTGTAYEAATAGVSGAVTAKELQSALIAAESTLNADWGDSTSSSPTPTHQLSQTAPREEVEFHDLKQERTAGTNATPNSTARKRCPQTSNFRARLYRPQIFCVLV